MGEYEIVAFSCILDTTKWKVEECIKTDEAKNLLDFPATLGQDLTDDCRRFIIFLMI